jgi:hypothetical protein
MRNFKKTQHLSSLRKSPPPMLVNSRKYIRPHWNFFSTKTQRAPSGAKVGPERLFVSEGDQ